MSQVRGCVTARCGSSHLPQFDPCSPQGLQSLSGQSIRLDHGGSWVQIPSGARIFPSLRISKNIMLLLLFELIIIIIMVTNHTLINWSKWVNAKTSGQVVKTSVAKNISLCHSPGQFTLVTRRPYCPGRPKELCFTTLSLAMESMRMRLSVVKQSFFGPPGQYGRLVTRANQIQSRTLLGSNQSES